MSYKHRLELPLKVLKYHRKRDNKDLWFNLNLNAFTQIAKNPHQRNQVKQNYQELINPILDHVPVTCGQISIKYTLFVGTKRKCDISNVCAIVDKYFCDAMVEKGIIPDDDYKHIVQVTYVFGGYEKGNPHCDVEIKYLTS